ncbi:MAG: cytochrome c oxidase accessory protein CcoG [Flavobacteriales bacterium]|jgi:cytochrome c oxidase accessory protein FixG|nr:cytochrome c oxidase accessory protein CcoG [Flavobacteriales bacterium]MCI1752876.1 cytochrome c oxidase accessory protein CcoG [Flavobacteriales bacterium]
MNEEPVPHHARREPSVPEGKEDFRDHIATVDQQGKRLWIFPKKPSGKYFRYRQWFGYSLLALLIIIPWLRINGEPFFLINLVERRFVILGRTFWPQDIQLFVLAFIIGIVFIALFTVAFGRLFCGWACPQTVFMELVFRRIEYWIEGDWKQQKALNKAPWSAEKAFKKTAKHLLFFAVSFLIGNIFFSYLIGTDQLLKIITEPPSQHLAGLGAMLGFSAVFYGVFAFMREQVCTTICPYGRLQGVLLDRESIVVAYDHQRGEARGLFRKGESREEANKGDCIDCHACVNVCPTGIDIRNGTQLECVNCTACIDACDHMMVATGQPTGLIRFASEAEIADKRTFRWTTRMKAYTAVLVVLIGALLAVVLTRSDVETTVLRTPGLLFQRQPDGRISNLYTYKLVNKTNKGMPIHFELMDHSGELNLVGGPPVLERASMAEGELFIILDKGQMDGYNTLLKVGVFTGSKQIATISTSFVGPMKKSTP